MSRPAFTLAAVAVAAFAAGIYLQHRAPLGRWFADRGPPPQQAAVTPADLARMPAGRRLVFVIFGQSNAANYGSVRASAGPGVYAFHAGQLYAATDPLPGADGLGGSLWTRLGATLLTDGRADAVVFAAAAQGSSTAQDWAPGGRHHARLTATFDALAAAHLPVDFVLWQQGESEGWSDAHAGRDYLQSLQSVVASCQARAPGARILIARATFGAGAPGNAQIRAAQLTATTLSGVSPGPDLDELGFAFRRDGIHFNARGLESAAQLWLDALHPWLPPAAAP